MKIYTEQLPSCKWRSKVVYTDPYGKKRSKSFTANIREQSRLQAAAYCEEMENRKRPEDETIDELLSRYIQSRENIVSLTTIRRYKIMAYAFREIRELPVGNLTQSMYQAVISQYAIGRKAKEVMEAHSLLKRAFRYNDIDFNFDDTKIKFPKSTKRKSTRPTDEELSLILEASRKKDILLPVLLAATLGMRRIEIFSLIWKAVDFENQKVYTFRNGAMCQFYLPEQFAKLFIERQGEVVRQSEAVFNYTMEAFDSRFKRVIASLGLKYNYHSLIRYSEYFEEKINRLNDTDEWVYPKFCVKSELDIVENNVLCGG